MIDFSMAYMLPLGVVFSMVAMMSGIGGAILFSPFFIIVLKLEPVVALGAGLFIEMFGMGAGVLGFLKQKSIHFDIVKVLIVFTFPATIFGVIIGRFLPAWILQVQLAMVLFYLGYSFYEGSKKCEPKHPEYTGHHGKHDDHEITQHIKSTSFLGGFLVGTISAGLGEINEYNFIEKLKMPLASASGTSVFLVTMSALIGVAFHSLFFFNEATPELLAEVISIVAFAIPGVIIGAEIGVYLAKRANVKSVEKWLSLVFVFLSVVTLIQIV